MKKFFQLFTYRSLNRKRFYSYFLAGAAILILVVVLLGVFGGVRAVQNKAAQATYTLPPLPTATPLPTPSPTPAPLACPTDPEEWDVYTPDPIAPHFNIVPDCVVQDLERTVAFAMMVRMGWSLEEAYTFLGFDDIPMYPQASMYVWRTEGELVRVNMSFHPPVSHLRAWFITQTLDESPIIFTPQRCYPPVEIVGGSVNNPTPFSVVCEASEWAFSQAGSLYCLDDLCAAYTANYELNIALFGYREGRWYWIGNLRGGLSQSSPLPFFADDNAEKTKIYDKSWLFSTFGLEERLLPENWQQFDTQENRDELIRRLSEWIRSQTP